MMANYKVWHFGTQVHKVGLETHRSHSEGKWG